jgi:hypothetical protein
MTHPDDFNCLANTEYTFGAWVVVVRYQANVAREEASEKVGNH